MNQTDIKFLVEDHFIKKLSFELELGADQFEMMCYNTLIAEYCEIPIEEILSVGSLSAKLLLNELHNCSEKKIIKKIVKDDIPLDELLVIELENDEESEINKIINDIQLEFDIANDMMSDKFNTNINNKEFGLSESSINYIEDFFKYTVKRIEKLYEDVEFDLNYEIVKFYYDDLVQSIKIVLIK